MKTFKERLIESLDISSSLNEGAKIGTLVKLHRPIGEHKYGVIKGYLRQNGKYYGDDGSIHNRGTTSIHLKKTPLDEDNTPIKSAAMACSEYKTITKDAAIKEHNSTLYKKGEHVRITIDGKTHTGTFEEYDVDSDKFIVKVGNETKNYSSSELSK